MNRAIDSLARAHYPIYAMVQRETVADLPQPQGPVLDESSSLRSPLYRSMEIEHQWIAPLDEALTFDTGSFLARLLDIADSLGSQMTNGILQHISDVADAEGLTIHAGERDFFDAFIEAAEKVDFSFDESGNPDMTVVVHPTLGKKLRDRSPTPEQTERMKQIIARKREEWYAARRRRELP